MLVANAAERRSLESVRLESDLVVVGGGLAGVCAAITAARAGIRVVLVQDRPVLGGNASSEVRLWVLGATSHMGNNNRWAREGGLVDEILVENLYRNPEGNPLILDTILLEKVVSEANITLLLNTAVYEVEKKSADTIASVRAFCSQNSTQYELAAPLFCDASGDGIAGFLAGAAFRMGAESRSEFGEKFAPSKEYGELLGHSIYFYSKDVGRPVKFVPPSYALSDIKAIPRYRKFNTKEYGCKLWWIEYGGRLDTVHQTEQIKWELWKVVYGVWNHIKNSGEFPDAANLTLEWVGQIPGKRESRRFEGDYLLRQQDLVEQRSHYDAVAYGGWSIDLHPADGVFSEKPGCNQWHTKGVYQIPYRCLYSRNISNLFLAGRIISATHVAFGSTRVMATAACAAQAAGMAAAMCKKQKLRPRDLAAPEKVGELQTELMRVGHFIPGLALSDPADLVRSASVSGSSVFRLAGFAPDGPMLPLESSWAMMVPLGAGPVPKFSFTVDAAKATTLKVEFRVSSKVGNHTPDVTVASRTVSLQAGKEQTVSMQFDASIDVPRYGFVCLMANPLVSVRTTEQRVTGVLSLCSKFNPAVATSNRQEPPEDIGVDTFEFWCPQRRPGGRNLAMSVSPAIELFAPQNVTSGVDRPVSSPNGWVADRRDNAPVLTLKWPSAVTIARVELMFDADFDHPAESVLMGHPESVMPFCVREYQISDGVTGKVLHECGDNHQSRNTIRLERPVTTTSLKVTLQHPLPNVPASLFSVRCYEE